MRPQPANTQDALPASPTPAQALSALLTLDQLTELINLISTITDSMLDRLSSAFDMSSSSPINSHERLPNDARNPNLAGERQGETAGDPARTQTRSERQVPEARLLNLKSDAMEWLQAWRDGVVASVVDALRVVRGADDGGDGGQRDPPPPEYEINDPYLNLPGNTALSSSSLTALYPPIPTSLSSLSQTTRTSLLSTMLLVLLSKGHYGAPSRILMLHLLSSLDLPISILQETEQKLAYGLLEAAKRMSASAETAARSAESATARRWKIGLAGVAGAALIGVTGGLAAPLVAGAIGTVMTGLGLGTTAVAGLLGTLGGSGMLVGGLFGAYGYGMTSQMMERYAKEVDDFAFLPMRKSKAREEAGSEVKDVAPEDRRLRVTIGVSGWITEKRDIRRPWRAIGSQSEVFALRWELKALLDMGKSIESMVSSAMWAVASRELIARTVFASLMFAMWPITLLKLSKVVDNPFNVAKNRADKAGLVLADAIINKAQGERPVTLIGYSMGARLIYSCLMSLAERRAFGLVESVVLIGTPAPSDASMWRAIRSVVAGRLVNVYAEKDYVLAFLYRTSSIQFGVAGLEAIDNVKGVENVDASSTVTGHFRYPHLVGTILENIGWEDINIQEVEREQKIVEILDKDDEEKLTGQREAVSEDGDKPRSRDDNENMHAREAADIKEYRPKLPDRGGSNPSYDPLGAINDTNASRDSQFKKVLAATVAKYVEREGPQRFRCCVPECEKFFKTEHFWKKHIESSHRSWMEGIEQQVRLSTSSADKTDKGEKPPTLPARPTPKLEEQDLISFDDTPSKDMIKGIDDEVHLLETGRHQNIMDMPEEQHSSPTNTFRKHRHSIPINAITEVKEEEEEVLEITMVDNEQTEIVLLEPVPWADDEETSHKSR